ncbi:hypothetical protein B4N89_20820 [Embleya scabrispora]|uniref:Uncharacterized protein n=1 Tax=Embleya scabrispora TaxID=159449 RepID=A0A1T3P1S4_9ACTN|nr:hypothetical protein [Embleya scabrispora]OPC83056.1 hypothetical protein B4N89_20820 [Embleya scabrispora]
MKPPTPQEFDALADAMNAALNNHYHADLCGCRTWPQSCHTAETFGSPYKPGYWDTSAFAIVLPLVWDEIVKAAGGQPQSYGEWFSKMLDDAEARGTSHNSTCTTGLCGWRQIHVERYERRVDGVMWALEECDETEIGPDDPGAGWFLYGPGPFEGGRFLVASDAVPTVGADAVIRNHNYLSGTESGGAK